MRPATEPHGLRASERGARRLFVFVCGSETFDAAVFDAFDERVGSPIEIPYLFFLVEHPLGNVLFDTGAHPDLVENACARMGPDVEKWNLQVTAADLAPACLQRAGIAVDSISHVVLSHLHYDHAGGLSQFPSAQHLVQQAELDFARHPAPFQSDIYIPADFSGEFTQLVGEYDVHGDESIVAFPTPGHTPGHQSLHVRLPNEEIILVGDAACSPEKLYARALPTGSLCWSAQQMCGSHDAIQARAELGHATLICGHDEQYRTRLKLAPHAWYE